MNICKNANDPQAMLYSMIKQNPQMKTAMDLIRQSGGDTQALFYKLAEQQGINPNDILDALK